MAQVKKNSGILRFTFGNQDLFPIDTPAPQFPALGGIVPVVLVCLGAGSDPQDPDSDGQSFGASPGHDAVVGTSFFAAAAALNPQPTDVLQANSPARLFPGNYIPAGTKVHAYFISTSTFSTPVAVQTEVTQSRIRRGAAFPGTSVADPSGDFFLGSIRVAVVAAGGVQGVAAGVLVVELQHSEHDIPGRPLQSAQFAVPAVP